jgi:protein-S-isoprenylcysteine O-methyltransferase Ste14
MPDASSEVRPVRPPRIFPPVYLLAAILGMIALDRLLPGTIILPGPWRWLGLVPLAGGLTLGGSAARLFWKHKTSIKPGDASAYLLTAGPYRFSRNPIYLGMALVLVGVAALLSSLTPWLLVPLFVWLIHRNVISVEEAMMAAVFGTEYQQYCERVRRWV